MPLTTACPNCGKRVTVGDALIGRRVRCPACKATLDARAAPPSRPSPVADPATRTPGQRRDGLFRFGLTCALVGTMGMMLPAFGLQLRKLHNLPPAGQVAAGGGILAIGLIAMASSYAPRLSRRAVRTLLIAGGSMAALFVIGVTAWLTLAGRPHRATPVGAAVPPGGGQSPGSGRPPGFAQPPAGFAPPGSYTPPGGFRPPQEAILRPRTLQASDPRVVRVRIAHAPPDAIAMLRPLLRARAMNDWSASGPTPVGEVDMLVQGELGAVRAWVTFGRITAATGRTLEVEWDPNFVAPATRPATRPARR